MKVLIAKINEPVIKRIFPKAIFTDSTKNTSTFDVSKQKFTKMLPEIKALGYNPYALMSW